MQNPNNLYKFDKEFMANNNIICGVDEAGRGPLCGPVCVAAVVLNYNDEIIGIDDSKKLTEKKRQALYEQIIQRAICYNIVMIDAQIIDEINILNASLLGMKNAVEGLELKTDLALIDGNKCPKINMQASAVVKGDSKSACIAAASVLAKVTRDKYMCELAKKYPQYMYEKHKGYPTKLHYEEIEKYGIQDFYRKSFLKKRGIV